MVGERTMLAICICNVDEMSSPTERSREAYLVWLPLATSSPFTFRKVMDVKASVFPTAHCQLRQIIRAAELGFGRTLLTNRRCLDLVAYPSTTTEICDCPG